ncbi:MAG: hypothetical protein EOP11_25705, partial [Proteobacteria bacterium]
MIKTILLSLTLLAPFTAHAGIVEDLSRIRGLLPEGSDVAQIQSSILQGVLPREAEENGQRNYVFQDFNRDGIEDLLVISEKNPTLHNWETDKDCESTSETYCVVQYGQRAIHFFVGEAGGALRQVFVNDKYVRNGDEGGVMGDPLYGFSANKNGTVTLNVSGGSAWRWGFSDVIQFRKG